MPGADNGATLPPHPPSLLPPPPPSCLTAPNVRGMFRLLSERGSPLPPRYPDHRQVCSIRPARMGPVGKGGRGAIRQGRGAHTQSDVQFPFEAECKAMVRATAGNVVNRRWGEPTGHC